MDQERERIQADLRGLLDGEVHCEMAFVQMYATDASVYELQPLGVVRPRGVHDVVATVQYAVENEIPIHARGAGSSLAGESLGRGLIIDFSHSMRRMVRCDEDKVRVQAGVVCSQLNRLLAGRGRCFGPDPATPSVSTMGSVIALNASGRRWLRYGSASDKIVSLQVVLADGTVVELGRHAVAHQSLKDQASARRQELVNGVAAILDKHQAVVQRQVTETAVNQSGYQLRGVLQSGEVDLTRLLAGSEGTLALITEATLRTEPLPPAVGVALLFFDRLELAARAAAGVVEMGASACELMDRRLLSIAGEQDTRFDRLVARDAEAMLLVEVQAEDADELRRRLQSMIVRLQRHERLAFDSRLALDRDEAAVYWQLVQRAVDGLYRLKGIGRPLPFVEGIAVPLHKLPEFLLRMQNVLKSHQVVASLFAHAGQGQLHLKPFLDLADPQSVAKMPGIAADLYEEVVEVGGTVSGEGGDGLSRSWFVRHQAGELFPVFREIKNLFDPRNILNPGKVAADVPQNLTENLRHEVPRGAVESVRSLSDHVPGSEPGGLAVQPHLAWDPASVIEASHACNGCGVCRTQMPDERMCPIFRYGPREEATPRAKANLMRAVLTGQLDPALLSSSDLKEMADLCVHCHQCRLECPAQVDIPRLMVECKAHYVATNGLRPSEWCAARIDWISSWGSFFHPFANWAIGNRQMRWALERMLGVAQGRKLPRFAAKSFQRVAHRRRLTRPAQRSDRKVLYFVDVFANWHDVELAEALVAIFEHNGISVYVPPGQVQSGMAAVSMGAVDVAKRLAQKNVQLLADAVRQGYHIIANEPSAALCLAYEYPSLLGDDDSRLVADNTSEACAYLWRLHQAGRLELDLKSVEASIGYHLPCHLRALNVGMPGYQLLRLVPGLRVQHLDQACSGMAGTFGLWRDNYRTSLRAGWGLIASLRDPDVQFGATECSACKMQMEQGTRKPTVHPLKLLALSYGLMPELTKLLDQPGMDMVVT